MKIVHLKKGDPYDVYVGRPTKYGNPFDVKTYGRDKALELYLNWLFETPQGLIIIESAKAELPGKVLACWCAPKGGIEAETKLICHAQILSVVANEISEETNSN